MGLLGDIGRAAFGRGQPAPRPSIPSTRDLEKRRRQREKEDAASAANRRKYRARVRRGDV